jgi:hypothetical protein
LSANAFSVTIDNFIINSADSVIWGTDKYIVSYGEYDSLILKPQPYNFISDGKNYPTHYLCTKDYASDSFDGIDGSLPDNRRWVNPSSYGSALSDFELLSGKLHFYPSNGEELLVKSAFRLVGNFDIQIDLDIVQDGGSDSIELWNQIHIQVNNGDSSKFAYVGRRKNSTETNLVANSDNISLTSFVTGLSSLKVRLVRSGSNLIGYRYVESWATKWGWQTEGTNIQLHSDLSDDLEVRIYGVRNGLSEFEVNLDNFKINSADAIYIDEKNMVPRVELNTDIISSKKLPLLKLLNPAKDKYKEK